MAQGPRPLRAQRGLDQMGIKTYYLGYSVLNTMDIPYRKFVIYGPVYIHWLGRYDGISGQFDGDT